jgi:hypothetical protein
MASGCNSRAIDQAMACRLAGSPRGGDFDPEKRRRSGPTAYHSECISLLLTDGTSDLGSFDLPLVEPTKSAQKNREYCLFNMGVSAMDAAWFGRGHRKLDRRNIEDVPAHQRGLGVASGSVSDEMYRTVSARDRPFG